MQFDNCCNNEETLIDRIKIDFLEKGGYTNIPFLIFWNLRYTDNFPTINSTPNSLKLSGNSVSLLKIFLEEVNKLSEEYKKEIYEVVNPKFTWIKTVLINSDFDLHYKVDREALHRSIIDEGYYSSFEPCIYPGVNIKYYYNKFKGNNGICDCEKMCNGKGKDNTCKKITIAVFNSGKIIITGGNSIEHIEIAYNFIYNFIESRKDIIQMK